MERDVMQVIFRETAVKVCFSSFSKFALLEFTLRSGGVGSVNVVLHKGIKLDRWMRGKVSVSLQFKNVGISQDGRKTNQCH